ncbi:MAG: WecB/TagA/CpsF family glycosyltransferase [Patescibacteria group bacterium]|nr:WecB/TagA/CpsF family glycosyltransferase [Patescibacteria group bacterium]
MNNYTNKLLSIPIPTDSKETILEDISKTVSQQINMIHVVSLNPETMIIAQDDPEFRAVLQSADIRLIDGVGVLTACLLRGIPAGERLTGVDFLQDTLDRLKHKRIRVQFLGGRPGIAEKLAKCYARRYPQSEFRGMTGISDISRYEAGHEDKLILREIAEFRPHMLFVSYGSPFQEKWIWNNRLSLRGCICAGVGGAFDFLVGDIPRAPKLLRRLGLEWAYRLVRQPWRWRRQLRLIRFLLYVILGK